MKLMVCDTCSSVVQIRRGVQSCLCGDISGRYLEDGRTVSITTCSFETTRIVGLPNWLRHGRVKEAQAWIISWDDEWIELKEE